MTRLLLQKKILLQEVYKKAKQESYENSFSAVIKYLEVVLKEDLRSQMSYKTFENYYKNIVEKNSDYNTKPYYLDDLSKYLGHRDFRNFCYEVEQKDLNNPQSAVRITVNDKDVADKKNVDPVSNVFVNITNSPIFSIPEFVTKHRNGIGLIGFLLIGGWLMNKQLSLSHNNDKLNLSSIMDSVAVMPTSNEREEIRTPQPIFQVLQKTEKQPEKKQISSENTKYMYWNGAEYKELENSNNSPQEYHLIELDKDKLQAFKKITLTDTITLNSVGRIYYSKYQNKLEFFTASGTNPNNGKHLKPTTAYIIQKYILSSQ